MSPFPGSFVDCDILFLSEHVYVVSLRSSFGSFASEFGLDAPRLSKNIATSSMIENPDTGLVTV